MSNPTARDRPAAGQIPLPDPIGQAPPPITDHQGRGRRGWRSWFGRPRPAARARRARHWFFATSGWLALVPVIVVLVLRWRSLDSPLTIAIAGITPFLAAPLVAADIGSVLSRSPTLRVAAAVTTAAFLFTTSPIDAVIGCRGETADDAITIYTANVLFDHGRPADVAASIVAQDADVVILQEVVWEFLAVLREDQRLSDYRYRSNDEPGAPYGTLVWSRWPFADVGIEPFQVSELVNATIAGPTGEFTVTGLHVLAPAQPSHIGQWQNQFAQLSRIDTGTPRVVAGDFNATSDHRQFRDLLAAGWTDVHDEKGCGFDATWPVDHGLPFPVMRLDHVLVTDDFEVLDVRFGDPAGSDHKPVVASIRLRD